MSLKKNIAANYVSQLYVTSVGILILPLYIKYMGAEGYGLVGFFTMLQSWFRLLDFGLTPTISRETARFYGGGMNALSYRQLFRALSVIFTSVAVIGGGGLLLFAEPVATRWLNVNELGMGEVVLAVQIMAVSVSLRWIGGLYRGVVSGAERLLWLSGFNVFIATLRFIVVFASMWLYGFTPVVFFIHQLVVALIEAGWLFLMSFRLLPSRNDLEGEIGWSVNPVKSVLKFSLTIAITSSVWVLVTQTDKLVLSGILPLAEYGYFTLAVLVANGVMVISGPVSLAIMPRMARLHAEGKNQELVHVYRKATQLISVIAGSASITIAFCAEPLLIAWTGNFDLAVKAAPILRLYVIGNGFLVISAFPYYLQYAKGSLRYHLIGNLAMVLFLIPSIIAAATFYGLLGAGYVWLTMNGLYFLVWVAYVHYKLEPGLHRKWLVEDCLGIYVPSIFVLMPLLWWAPVDKSRWMMLSYVLAAGLVTLLTAMVSSKSFRDFLIIKLKSKGKYGFRG